MTKRWLGAVLMLASMSSLACTRGPGLNRWVRSGSAATLETFDSAEQLRSYLAEVNEQRNQAGQAGWEGETPTEQGYGYDFADDPLTAGGFGPNDAVIRVRPGPARASQDEAITNVQEQGVDEGGIVKAHGELLVVLRRGRLFTIRLDDHALVPVSAVDVFPGTAADGWYDEMLVSGDRIVVVGYSYAAGATEIGIFSLDPRGIIRHLETRYLRSNDYYSSRNYASRLIGRTLIFYLPHALGGRTRPDGLLRLPALASFSGEAASPDRSWRDIVTATRIVRPIQPTLSPVLHTVVACDLSQPSLTCQARGVIGPPQRNYYVAPEAVYVWVNNDEEAAATRSTGAVAYRLPLSSAAITALHVYGGPVDQFSFKEDEEGFLNVLVRAETHGGGMWGGEVSAGGVALLRVPVATFSSRPADVLESAYVSLPGPDDDGAPFHNRFVGDHLLYGTGSGWGLFGETRRPSRVFVYPYRAGGSVHAVPLRHGVDRIEPMGRAAVVVGSDGDDLHFSSISLDRHPAVAGRYRQAHASQGELRSHGFFYRPTDPRGGVLGLPVRGGQDPGYEHLFEGSASVLYLSVHDLRFSQLGELRARDTDNHDYCIASCVDWYGNARPIFYRDRVFALLGYELVEGRIAAGKMHEIRRVSFLPRGPAFAERRRVVLGEDL